jgi:transcriptional regulator with XRE-family HTH domain
MTTTQIFTKAFFKANISKTELEGITGIDKNNILKYIKGEHELKFSTFKRLMNGLGKDVDIIVKDK